jgi:hypothetical protein
MRLFEVEDRFANDLEMVLRNLMGRSNEKKASLKLSYPALSNLLKNMGYGGIEYDTFQKVYDANPALQNIVRDFDENEIRVTTDIEDTEDDQEQGDGLPDSKSVDQMASAGAKAALNNPLA